MEGLQTMSVDDYVAAMRGECERVLREVGQAVNAAGAGRLIRDSEEPVRDLMGRLRTAAYEKALQMRIDASEASFSPGGRRGAGSAGQGAERTGGGDGQRGGAAGAAAV
jgi:hypothetical protein